MGNLLNGVLFIVGGGLITYFGIIFGLSMNDTFGIPHNTIAKFIALGGLITVITGIVKIIK